MKLKKTMIISLFVIIIFAFLYYLSTINYLVLHSFIELFVAAVAITIFSIGWNTRKYTQNMSVIILSVGYLIVGILTIFHALSFKGMGVFPEYGANLPTQFWIATRYVESITILVSVHYFGKKQNINTGVFLLLSLLGGALIVFIIFQGFFPDCFIDGLGLTFFKIASEYIICSILLVSAYLFWKRKNYMEKDFLLYILSAIAFTIIAELSFTLYDDPYGFFNFLGHYFMVFSLLLLYFAFVQISLTRPYEFLFNNIDKHNEELIRKNQELSIKDMAISTANSPIYFATPEGYIFDVNPSFLQVWGYNDKSDVLGKNIVDLWPESSQPQIMFQKLIKNRYWKGEMTGRKDDGALLHAYVSAHVVEDENNQPLSLMTSLVDITKRKQAEEMLLFERSQFLSIYDSINEYIYVVDLHTYEILYVNNYMKRVFSKDLVGGICYQELQNKEAPCEFCTNDILFQNKSEPYRWDYHNALLNRYFLVTDKIINWPDGREVRFEIAIDITSQKKMEQKLLESLNYEKRVSDMSTSLLKIKDIDVGINEALDLMGNLFAADRSYIFVFSENGKTMNNIYEWCSQGTEPRMAMLQNLSVDTFPAWTDKLNKGEIINFTDVSKMEPAAKNEQEILQAQSIKSVVVLPMFNEEELAGFVGIDFVTRKTVLNPEQINQLKLISELITTAFLRKETEVKLEEAYYQLEDEIFKAEKIHQKVLPLELPQTEKISIAAYNQPATQMGGDSYNVIRSGNKLVIYLADVMGHGLDGAMISFFIKEAIDSYVVLKPDELSPQKIMQHLNNQYRRESFPDIQIIAIFLAVLDLEKDKFKYSSAGFQTRPLIRMGDGSKEMLDTTGMFISNTVPEEILNFEERTLNLTSGATILISTDGLSEQYNGEEMFHEKYVEIFYKNSNLPPEIILQAINKDLWFFNSNSLVGIDDITYLVLQYNKNQQKKHSLKIESDFAKLDGVYEKITELTAIFPGKANLITCLHELVVNAIEHGNRHDPGKIVKIDLTVTKEYVLAEVEDEGEGFDWSEKLDKPIDMRLSSIRGRGIALTGLMSGNLYYNAKGNKATLLVQSSQ